jgi:hypothetical protein
MFQPALRAHKGNRSRHASRFPSAGNFQVLEIPSAGNSKVLEIPSAGNSKVLEIPAAGNSCSKIPG